MSSARSRLINSAAAEVELDAVVDNRCVVDGFKLETKKRHAHHCRHSLAKNSIKKVKIFENFRENLKIFLNLFFIKKFYFPLKFSIN